MGFELRGAGIVTIERAKAILETSRRNVPTMRTYARQIEKAKGKIEVKQKLTATYGKERVKGGKLGLNPVDDALIKAEQDVVFYTQKLEELKDIQHKASIIIHCLPKKYWKVMNAYYLKALPVQQIAKKAGFSTRKSIYDMFSEIERELIEILKSA